MNKLFGAQGEIANFPFKDLHAPFYNQNGIEIEIKDGILYVGVDDESKLEEAKELARLYLFAWSERQNIKVGVDFNHTWKTSAQGNEHHFLEIHDTAQVTDRVQIQTVTHQVTIKGTASIVTQQMYDSASPVNDTPMVNKALKDTTLKNALRYFSEEIVNSDKPLSGVYKALEEITRHMGKGSESKGRTELVKLVGETKKYVDDIMETTQTDRHSEEWLALKKAKAVFSDNECKERARILINAYANTLP
ncbi:MAG TPA: hypothetical protein VEP90_01405 [Methylomirabilota bacterium]|nr:hypothetical protein [Methylomirabilota bacterium]